MYHKLIILFTINAKDLVMQLENNTIYKLELITIFGIANKNPITFGQGCTSVLIMLTTKRLNTVNFNAVKHQNYVAPYNQ